MPKITDKIKEMLSPEDLKIFESAIEDLIDEKVTRKVSLSEEEMKNKYDLIAEEYCQKQISEGMEKEKATLISEYDKKLVNLEKKIVTKLDSFLDQMIAEQISDTALEKIAVNEVAYPVVAGIKKLFSENYVELDTEGSNIVKKSSEKVKELENQLSESIAKRMELDERLEKTATFLLINEKTEGMTQTQKARVTKFFKDKKFDEVKSKIDMFVEMVNTKEEKKVVSEGKKKDIIDSVLTEKDGIKKPKKVKSLDESENSMLDLANSLV